MLFLSFFRFFKTAFYKSEDEISVVLKCQLFLLFLYSFINANVSGTIIGNRVMFTFIAILFISSRFFKTHNKTNYTEKSA